MAIAGFGGKVKIGTQPISQCGEWQLDIEVETKDISNFDTVGGWKEFLATIKSWTGSCKAMWNIKVDTTGQKAMQDAFLAGTTISLELDIDSSSKYSGTAIIQKLSASSKADDIVSLSLNFQGTGALTFTP